MAVKTNGFSRLITVNPTVAEAVYHANDCVGGKLTLNDVMLVEGGQAYLYNVFAIDASNQKPALEIVLFRADPTAATLTDHAAIVFSTDISKVVAKISIAATDWVTIGGAAFANVTDPRILEVDAGNKLYAAIMAVATPDFVATTDLSLKFGFSRDP